MGGGEEEGNGENGRRRRKEKEMEEERDMMMDVKEKNEIHVMRKGGLTIEDMEVEVRD